MTTQVEFAEAISSVAEASMKSNNGEEINIAFDNVLRCFESILDDDKEKLEFLINAELMAAFLIFNGFREKV